MNLNFLIICMSAFLALPCKATSKLYSINLSNITSGKSNILADQSLKEITDFDSYDLSKQGGCTVCRTLTSTICAKCQKVFFCSKECQKLNKKIHKIKCYDYYHDNRFATKRKEYNNFLNSYDSLNLFQYYPKQDQKKCVDTYLRANEEGYGFIIPNGIRSLIFLMCYAPPEDREFKNELDTSLKVDEEVDSGWYDLRLSTLNPIYLVRFLQYIYQKERAGQVVDCRVKSCLLIRISYVYVLLGYFFCFSLQKKLMIVSRKVIDEKDAKLIRELPWLDRAKYMPENLLPAFNLSHDKILPGWSFWYILKKKEKKALQYSSIAGWINLARELQEKKF